MSITVAEYFLEGCGRCKLGGTPDCKVHTWASELKVLRDLVLDSGLTEEVKWSVPCYTFQNSNILIMSAFKDYCALSFFKGALLNDSHNLLIQPGENTQAARLMKFTQVDQIIKNKDIIKAYIFEAIEIEKLGLKVEFKKTANQDIPEEFQNRLDQDPALKSAFESLTPGRQRGYLLHFSQAKQAKTRDARIDKSIDKIFEGKGMMER